MLKRSLLLFLFLYSFCLFPENKVDSLQYFLDMKCSVEKADALLRLARPLESSDLEKAFYVMGEALNCSREIKYSQAEIDALIGFAIINNYQGNSSKADSFLQVALPITIKTKSRSSEGNIYNNLGMNYFDRFDYEKSLQYYFKALTIFDELKAETKYASTLNNIANLYYTLKEFDKSLSYHQQSLATSRKLGEKSKIASSLYNIGLVYLEKNDPLKALSCFQESLQNAKEINHKVGMAMLYNSVGKCYRLLKDNEKALEYSFHSLDLKKEIGDETGVATLHNSIGNIYHEMRNYDKAIEYQELSLQEAKKVKNLGIMQNVYQSLANIYSAQKKYDLAFKNYKLYSEFKDSVFNTEKSQQLAEMSTKYETVRKDKELVMKDGEIKIREADSKRKETQRNAFIFGFIVVGVLAILVFRTLKEKQKVNKKLLLAYDEIDYKNKLVEEKNKNITDSINYARRIQSALMASENLLQKNLPSYFIFYRPKDIVSGDFYWAHSTENQKEFLICTGDCTGHGVPGAFMSLLGITSLNEIVIEKNISQPGRILDLLRNQLIRVLNPEGSAQQSYEGMDCSLCKYNFETMELEIAAANNNVWHINQEQILTEYSADKQPVGYHPDPKPFSTFNVKLQKNDMIYTFTDGFADQFGGPKGKKYKKKQLQQLLVSVSQQPLEWQKEHLGRILDEWKGNLEQIDDILIIGIKVS